MEQNIKSNVSFEDNGKTIGIFLEIVKKRNQLLETSKSENKLENLLNYRKYLSDIKFAAKKNLVTINSAKWFNGLTIYLVTLGYLI
ncbi:hypothetical protein [Rickettsia australis]|uniref:Uncharacterized protein n=1 Tax=Rickettsia australis (strain Cutlack) TaxID=1105110 RepID=H8K8X8_RICAC|nr:hypothetical protein [Rickettsia australis]AFC70498.1 hypothetical protein MC5_00340 [Rickettsia australis str. Cutlack]